MDGSITLFQVAKQYGGDGKTSMTAFPDIKFAEPQLDDINLSSGN